MLVHALINFDRQFSSVLARWRHGPLVEGGLALDYKACLFVRVSYVPFHFGVKRQNYYLYMILSAVLALLVDSQLLNIWSHTVKPFFRNSIFACVHVYTSSGVFRLRLKT